jgi:hypothetical protein
MATSEMARVSMVSAIHDPSNAHETRSGRDDSGVVDDQVRWDFWDVSWRIWDSKAEYSGEL